MLHPHKVIYIKEKWKEKNKKDIYTNDVLSNIPHILEFREKWFFFQREMVQQGEMERKNKKIRGQLDLADVKK